MVDLNKLAQFLSEIGRHVCTVRVTHTLGTLGIDSVWCVVDSVCGAIDTHTLVELASLAPRDEALAIWIPGNAGQAVLVRLAHLGPQLPCLDEEDHRQG